MIHGPDITEMATRAKAQVQEHFVRLGESDGTPATLRAMYVLKVSQAETVLAGGESLNRQIEREAETRGYTAYQMATIILYMAGESIELEDKRIKINVAIDAAETEDQIIDLLADVGLEFSFDLDK